MGTFPLVTDSHHLVYVVYNLWISFLPYLLSVFFFAPLYRQASRTVWLLSPSEFYLFLVGWRSPLKELGKFLLGPLAPVQDFAQAITTLLTICTIRWHLICVFLPKLTEVWQQNYVGTFRGPSNGLNPERQETLMERNSTALPTWPILGMSVCFRLHDYRHHSLLGIFSVSFSFTWSLKAVQGRTRCFHMHPYAVNVVMRDHRT